MKIKKIGHCCLVVEINGKRLMTDPGTFTTAQNEEKNIDIILISHEHADHFHVDSLKAVTKNNPKVIVITNSAVGKLLDAASITYQIIEKGQKENILGVEIRSFGNIHAEIYGEQGRVQNTGYLIEKLCYPGDAFENPHMPVDILALPVAGPWMRIKDAIDYAKVVKPRIAFPVHDAIMNSQFAGFVPKMVGNFLSESGILMKEMKLGAEEEV